MYSIDFHYNVPKRLPYACLVAKTVLRRGLRLAVWTRNVERLKALDALLWSFNDLAFVPHVGPEHPLAPKTPVLLGADLNALTGDVLLLIDDDLPEGWQQAFARFSRIIDVVSLDPEETRLSRARYRAYRDAGVELKAYDRKH